MQPFAVGVVRGQRRAADLLEARRSARELALRRGAGAFRRVLAVLHRDEHAIERHGDGHGLLRDLLLGTQRGLELHALLLPPGRHVLWQPVQAAFGRLHAAKQPEQVLALLRREVRHDPRRLLRRQRRPEAADHAGAQLHRARCAFAIEAGRVEGPHDARRAGCRDVGLLAAQHLSMGNAVDLDGRQVHIEARQFLGHDLGLGSGEQGVQLALELLQVLYRILGATSRLEERPQPLARARSGTGHRWRNLRSWHRGIPPGRVFRRPRLTSGGSAPPTSSRRSQHSVTDAGADRRIPEEFHANVGSTPKSLVAHRAPWRGRSSATSHRR